MLKFHVKVFVIVFEDEPNVKMEGSSNTTLTKSVSTSEAQKYIVEAIEK